MLKKKVFILDYEMISPIAVGVEQLAESIRSNYSAEKQIERISTEGCVFRKAAEVTEDLTKYYENESEGLKKAFSGDRKLELMAACYGKAASRLEKLIGMLNPTKTGVIVGVGADVTPFELFEDDLREYINQGYNPLFELYSEINDNGMRVNVISNPYDIYALYLANKFKAGAFQKSVLTACVSSTQAIALGYDAIAKGDAELVIVGGTDSLINLLAIISFGKLGVIPESKNEISCKPFDVNRNGALAGECAGFALLASEDFVAENNISPIAELLGYGNTLDAYKITAPDPNGHSMTKAIKDAMDNANLTADMLDYINAHGTGTKHNDQLELSCYESALGDFAKTIPISSTKDRHGHAIAAAGIQELCVVLESMKHNLIPGNRNLVNSCDPSFNLLTKNTTKKIEYALTSNFAFGGINTVLAVKNLRK
jgi:3-oxoacyl-[acyl-carrier-protein] synthase II